MLLGIAVGLGAMAVAAPAAAQNFTGQIVMSGWGACPPDARLADGQLLPIQKEKPAAGEDFRDLYLLYGTAYGGDGVTTFALPDMRGQAIGMNSFGHGAAPKTGDEHTAPAMRVELPVVFCVVIHGGKVAK
jgi:microcystin-dependent protein